MLTKQEKEYLLKLVESKKESLEKAILNNTNECSSCIKLEFPNCNNKLNQNISG